MKQIISILVCILSLSLYAWNTYAWFFDQFIDGGSPAIRYCDNPWECGLDQWTNIIRGEIDGIETERPLSQYVQDVVLYLLTFISLIAIIYIIYAGFQILIWNGDEEKMKKSKQTIIYVVIWIAIIWLAWPLTLFIYRALWA